MSENNKQGNGQVPSIRNLYPGHTEEWYAEAEANLERYVAVMIRIAKRLRSEGKSLKDLD